MAASEMKGAVVPPSPEERFHGNMKGLCSHVQIVLQRLVENKVTNVNMTLIEFANAIILGMPKDKLIKDFIYYTYEHWDRILVKNRAFFIENASDMMKDLPAVDIGPFKTIFEAKTVTGAYLIPDDHEDSQIFWTFFISLVKISIKYVYSKKEPSKVRVGKEEVEFQKGIDWAALKSKWSLLSLS